jgi:hypothetical protein
MDKDIKDSLDSTTSSETALDYKWDVKALQLDADIQIESDPICSTAGCSQYMHPSQPKPYPMDYVVPNFGVDKDIDDHNSNLAKTEALLGKKFNPKEKEASHPVDYKVPNFGVDQDIKDATSNIANAE